MLLVSLLVTTGGDFFNRREPLPVLARRDVRSLLELRFRGGTGAAVRLVRSGVLPSVASVAPAVGKVVAAAADCKAVESLPPSRAGPRPPLARSRLMPIPVSTIVNPVDADLLAPTASG